MPFTHLGGSGRSINMVSSILKSEGVDPKSPESKKIKGRGHKRTFKQELLDMKMAAGIYIKIHSNNYMLQ